MLNALKVQSYLILATETYSLNRYLLSTHVDLAVIKTYLGWRSSFSEWGLEAPAGYIACLKSQQSHCLFCKRKKRTGTVRQWENLSNDQ